MMNHKSNSFIIVVLFVSISGMLFAEPVYIPDSALKACIEQELGITDPSEIQMHLLTNLNCQSKGITNLTGL